MGIGEFAVIDRYFRPLAGAGGLGLVDDAAKLSPAPGQDLVVTTDLIARDVHFFADDPPESVARKALRVNLSDLAGKGARPVGYLLSAALPAPFDEDWISAFAGGLAVDQETYGIALLGGDTIAYDAGPLVSVTAIGQVPNGEMVLRSGGRAGDRVYATGRLGGAAVGLAIRRDEDGPWDRLSATQKRALVGRYRIPEPRCGLADSVRRFATAAMDISDGLVGDLDKLAAGSGCSATIEVDSIPVDPHLATIASSDPVRQMVLAGGDDYELLVCVAPERASGFEAAAMDTGILVTAIGSLTAGSGPIAVKQGGREIELPSRSYSHAEPNRVETANAGDSR